MTIYNSTVSVDIDTLANHPLVSKKARGLLVAMSAKMGHIPDDYSLERYLAIFTSHTLSTKHLISY